MVWSSKMARGGRVERKRLRSETLLWNRLRRPYREKKQHCSWYKFAEWSDREVTCVQSCQCPVFCEELEERSGQGVRLGFVCTNANCSLIQMPFNSSSKSGKLFDINRASTLAFRAIGRGQLAAAKTLSILGLPKPSSKPVWCENTKIIVQAETLRLHTLPHEFPVTWGAWLPSFQ